MKTAIQIWRLLSANNIEVVLKNQNLVLDQHTFIELLNKEDSTILDLFIFRKSIEESELDKYLAYQQFRKDLRKDEKKQKTFCKIFQIIDYKEFQKEYEKLDSYPDEFYDDNLRKSIIESQSYICGLCERKLDGIYPQLHHIDYNKSNCHPSNLIFLCPKCHGKTNFNRTFWQNILTEKKG
jgi:5-methylcytosine-specific restriction endonuclease McrA